MKVRGKRSMKRTLVEDESKNRNTYFSTRRCISSSLFKRRLLRLNSVLLPQSALSTDKFLRSCGKSLFSMNGRTFHRAGRSSPNRDIIPSLRLNSILNSSSEISCFNLHQPTDCIILIVTSSFITYETPFCFLDVPPLSSNFSLECEATKSSYSDKR